MFRHVWLASCAVFRSPRICTCHAQFPGCSSSLLACVFGLLVISWPHAEDGLPFLTFFFEPFPNLFPVDTEPCLPLRGLLLGVALPLPIIVLNFTRYESPASARPGQRCLGLRVLLPVKFSSGTGSGFRGSEAGSGFRDIFPNLREKNFQMHVGPAKYPPPPPPFCVGNDRNTRSCNLEMVWLRGCC